MAERCGVHHPDDLTVLCRAKGDHADHLNGAHIWPNTEWLESRPRQVVSHDHRSLQVRVREAARNAQVQRPIGAPRIHTGVPIEAMIRWTNSGWVDYATAEFRRFLEGRVEQFTTPEHFWPQIEAPPQMRALSVVVQGALRREWIEEVGAIRLREVYHTADGFQFPMNKLVPVYRSRIAVSVGPQ